jgi:hypothetical protein
MVGLAALFGRSLDRLLCRFGGQRKRRRWQLSRRDRRDCLGPGRSYHSRGWHPAVRGSCFAELARRSAPSHREKSQGKRFPRTPPEYSRHRSPDLRDPPKCQVFISPLRRREGTASPFGVFAREILGLASLALRPLEATATLVAFASQTQSKIVMLGQSRTRRSP